MYRPTLTLETTRRPVQWHLVRNFGRMAPGVTGCRPVPRLPFLAIVAGSGREIVGWRIITFLTPSPLPRISYWRCPMRSKKLFLFVALAVLSIASCGLTRRLECVNGRGCSCAGSDCDLFCPAGTSCDLKCSGGAICGNIHCADAPCGVVCSGGSACQAIGCSGAASCAVTCSENSACNINCSDAANCQAVSCSGGSPCLLRCTGSAQCKFQECSGGSGQMSCPGNVVVCNRPC